VDIEDFIKTCARVAREKGWWLESYEEHTVCCLNAVRTSDGVGERNFGEAIALMHSELSEALEEWRDGTPPFYYRCKDCGTGDEGTTEVLLRCPNHNLKPEGVLSEFADILIRVPDLVGNVYGSEVFVEALKGKMAFNLTREHRHGGKRA